MFKQGPLARLIDEAGNPIIGLADRGYASKDPALATTRCLVTIAKKPAGQVLPEATRRWNHVKSAIRIEVERSIGRLKVFERLSKVYKGKKPLEGKLADHYQIFYCVQQLTNMWIDEEPMRAEPHWLLCLEGLNERRVWKVYQAYLRAEGSPRLAAIFKAMGGMDYVRS